MLQTNIGEDLEVVRPGRVGEVGSALGVGLVELLQEKGAQVHGAGTGDGLQAGNLRTVSVTGHVTVGRATNSLFLEGGAVTAEDKLLRGGGEVG